MKNQETLDAGLIDTNIDEQLKAGRKKCLILILILIIINTLLFGFLIKGPNSTSENFIIAIQSNLISFNVVGFILGTLVALFPFRGLPYQKKYLRASLLSISALQIIMLFGLLLIGGMTLMGWY